MSASAVSAPAAWRVRALPSASSAATAASASRAASRAARATAPASSSPAASGASQSPGRWWRQTGQASPGVEAERGERRRFRALRGRQMFRRPRRPRGPRRGPLPAPPRACGRTRPLRRGAQRAASGPRRVRSSARCTGRAADRRRRGAGAPASAASWRGGRFSACPSAVRRAASAPSARPSASARFRAASSAVARRSARRLPGGRGEAGEGLPSVVRAAATSALVAPSSAGTRASSSSRAACRSWLAASSSARRRSAAVMGASVPVTRSMSRPRSRSATPDASSRALAAESSVSWAAARGPFVLRGRGRAPVCRLAGRLQLGEVRGGVVGVDRGRLRQPFAQQPGLVAGGAGQLSRRLELVGAPDLPQDAAAVGRSVLDEQAGEAALGQDDGAQERLAVEPQQRPDAVVDGLDLLDLLGRGAVGVEAPELRARRADPPLTVAPQRARDLPRLARHPELEHHAELRRRVVHQLLVALGGERRLAVEGVGDGLEDGRLAGPGVADDGDVVAAGEVEGHRRPERPQPLDGEAEGAHVSAASGSIRARGARAAGTTAAVRW